MIDCYSVEKESLNRVEHFDTHCPNCNTVLCKTKKIGSEINHEVYPSANKDHGHDVIYPNGDLLPTNFEYSENSWDIHFGVGQCQSCMSNFIGLYLEGINKSVDALYVRTSEYENYVNAKLFSAGDKCRVEFY